MSTWYLSPTGNDTTGNGSYANPWLTISKAHTSATAGDTVVYKNGTYTITANQTFTKGLTISAETEGSVILDCANSSYAWSGATSVAMVVSGIIFYRWRTAANSYTFGMGNCAYSNNIYYSCNLVNSADGLGYTGFIGFNAASPTITVTNCTWRDFWTITYAGQLFSIRESTGAGTLAVNNCVFYFSTASVANSGLFAKYGTVATTMTIKNSIIYDANARWILNKNSSAATMSYSDAYNWATPPTGTGVITSDPLFVDAASGNYNLRPTSPCIGSGSA